jgi:hypothetical protein
MSLDGFIAGPSAGRSPEGRRVATASCSTRTTAAQVHTSWDEGEVGWPHPAPFRAPVFVLTHRPREPWGHEGGTTFTFVTDGPEAALEQAKAAPREKTCLSRAPRHGRSL